MTLSVGDEVNVREIWLDDERVENFPMKVDYIEGDWFEVKGGYNGLFHYLKFPIDMLDTLHEMGITINKGAN